MSHTVAPPTVAPPTVAERLSSALWGPLLMHNAERIARLLRHAPSLRPESLGVAVETGGRYGPLPEHRFDVYRPVNAGAALPLAIYIHGGGFQFFDRRTHWAMATEIARRGYVVVTIDYRLAPRHRFPAAVQDAALAYRYVADHAEALGADPTRLLLAGESAGANLVLGLAIARCWRHDAPHARDVWDAPMHPTVLLPACGYLQVSDPGRHGRHQRLSRVIDARVHAVSRSYLPAHTPALPSHAFANPLAMVEAAAAPERRFPATYALVGSVDPVVTDTLRLGAALARLDVDHEVAVYPGHGHTFHALTFTEPGRRAWAEQMAFAARSGSQ
jgi:acetyl esterase